MQLKSHSSCWEIYSIFPELFVAGEENSGHSLEVDHLLILQYLMRHAEIDAATAALVLPT